MAAPAGNKNAAKGKLWESAIRRALARAEGSVDSGLDKVADKLVGAAIAGDPVARAEIGNRLDGKPTEHVHVESEVTVSVGQSEDLTGRLNEALTKRTSATVQ